MQAPINIEDIPGYREALERENRIRVAAFDDDLPEFVCGVEVKPLNLTHVLRLRSLQSPFMCGGRVPLPKDVIVFLWCISPDYEAALWIRNRLGPFLPRLSRFIFSMMRKRFARRLRKIKYIESVREISKFVNEAYQDSPGDSQRGFSVSYYAGATSIVAILAEKFHWSQREIMAMPVKRVFQFQRWLTLDNNPKAVLFNPSDKTRREGLQTLLKGN